MRPRARHAQNPADGIGDGPPPTARSGALRAVAGGALILALVLVAYGPALRGGFIWDDDAYVTDNVHLRSTAGLANIWFELGATPQYYPAVFTTFWIEYHLWKYDPLGYHVVNVVLHALGAVLLWRVLGRLTVPGAWLAAAVFALHPVQVESVAWITERKNVLSGVFYFAALLAYIRFASLDMDRPPLRHRRAYYGLAMLLFCLALLSKTVTCSLPAAILLLLWWKRKRLDLREILPLLPMFAVGLAMGLLTAWMEKHTVGAGGAEWSLTFGQRALLAGRVLLFYLGKLVWPAKLTFFYPQWAVDAGAWWQYLYPLAAGVAVALLYSKRSSWGKAWLVAALFFGGTLFPSLGFIDVYPMRYSYVADHFQYLASAGPIVVLVALACALVKRIRFRYLVAVTRASSVALLITLAVITWRQNQIYKDVETLWRDTIDKNPNAWMAYNNLGAVLKRRGQVDDAVALYRKAVDIHPDCLEAHGNLAVIMLERGRIEEALKHWKEAVRLRPYASARRYRQVADLLNDHGWAGEAVLQYRKALELDPDLLAARTGLAAALLADGQPDEAAAECRRALTDHPDSASAHYHLGTALFRSREVDQAIEHYREALRLEPGLADAHTGLGAALGVQGRFDESVAEFREAVRLKPDVAESRRGLGMALARQGKIEEAVEEWQQAVAVAPADVRLRCLLADHLLKLNRPEDAAAHYRQALALDPNCQEARQGLQSATEHPQPRPR